jgi:hypothetical protein
MEDHLRRQEEIDKKVNERKRRRGSGGGRGGHGGKGTGERDLVDRSLVAGEIIQRLSGG